jgi:hypothetical protein
MAEYKIRPWRMINAVIIKDIANKVNLPLEDAAEDSTQEME